MTRAQIDYTQATVQPPAVAGAVDVSKPAPGFFRHRPRGGSVIGGVKIFYGPPTDPVTGEEMDRSWRWQALFDGEPFDFDDVWPGCAGDPITEMQYRALCARREWARQNAPGSAYAQPGKRYDPLNSAEPLPF